MCTQVDASYADVCVYLRVCVFVCVETGVKQVIFPVSHGSSLFHSRL